MTKATPEKEIELHPDAWDRFERAVDAVSKAPPQHRKAKKVKKVKPKKRRSPKGASKRA